MSMAKRTEQTARHRAFSGLAPTSVAHNQNVHAAPHTVGYTDVSDNIGTVHAYDSWNTFCSTVISPCNTLHTLRTEHCSRCSIVPSLGKHCRSLRTKTNMRTEKQTGRLCMRDLKRLRRREPKCEPLTGTDDTIHVAAAKKLEKRTDSRAYIATGIFPHILDMYAA